MSYVKHILQPGEQVLVIGKLHWIIYLQSILWLISAAISGLFSVHFQTTDYQWPLVALTFVFLILGVYNLLRTWLRSSSTEIAVTTTRVVYKTGFIHRHTIEMNMEKVESVTVDQSILGRILDYGTVDIRGTGASIERLKLISHAIELRNSITSR